MTLLTCSCGHVASAISKPAAAQAMADHIVAVHACVRAADLMGLSVHAGQPEPR